MLPFSHKNKLWHSRENNTTETHETAERCEGTTVKMEQMFKKATKVLINPLGTGSPAWGALRKREPRGTGEKGRDSQANEAIRPLLAWHVSRFLLFAEELCVAEKDAPIPSWNNQRYGFASKHPQLPSFMSVLVPSPSHPAGHQSYI